MTTTSWRRRAEKCALPPARGRSAVVTHTHQEYGHSTRKRISAHPCARPGFASTSAYFKRLGQKEVPVGGSRQRPLEENGLFRGLARVIPTMPRVYEKT